MNILLYMGLLTNEYLYFHFILFSHFHENNIVKFQVMYIVRAIWITT